MKIKCKDVIVRNRYRKDFGDLDELMDSINFLGLLQPIGITKDKELIFGQRRLLACQKLGHDKIEARVVDVPSIIEGEYAENEIRKDFTVSERVAIGKAIEEGIGERRGGDHGNQYTGAKAHKVADCQDKLSGKETREIASGIAGFGSRESYRRAKEIVEKGTPELIEKVDTEKVTIAAAFKEIMRAEKKAERDKEMIEAAKDYKEDESIQIINDDFYPWCTENIENNSVDLILTDPPYPKEYLPLWSQLGEVANKVLKPGGFMIAYSGQYHLPEVINRLSEYLTYYWIGCLYHTGPSQIVNARNVMCKWKPILIFQKEPLTKKDVTMPDYVVSDAPDKDSHAWGQSESGVTKLMEYFSAPNDLVLDPMVGGGTTLAVAKALKRRCIGIEIDPQYMDVIKSRLI